jgi:hypothetical protein
MFGNKCLNPNVYIPNIEFMTFEAAMHSDRAEISGGKILIYFIIFFCLFLSVAAMPSGRFVVVVTEPGEPAGHVIDVIGTAGGSFVAPGAFSWIAVAYSDADNFPARLRRSGALFVLNHALAVGCLQKES